MIYLIITILLNVFITSLFKIFPKYNINSFQAIVVNYLVCVVTGSLFLGSFPIAKVSFEQPWLFAALLVGCCFISIFYLIGYCTVKEGMTTTTIANKLSMVIPLCLSIVLYNEPIGWMKIVGVAIAIPAVYFSTRSNKQKKETKTKHWMLPTVLFVSSGLLDSLLKFIEQKYLHAPESQASFTIHTFATAGLIGILIISTQLVRKKISILLKNIIAGIVLGIPNYFSIYFLIRLLNSSFLKSSASIPINNISILTLSTLVAAFLFKEKMTKSKLIGISLSVIAILLIGLAD